MKKIVALTMALILVLSLAACGGSSASSSSSAAPAPAAAASSSSATAEASAPAATSSDTSAPAPAAPTSGKAYPNCNEDGSINYDTIAHYDPDYDYTQNEKFKVAYIAESGTALSRTPMVWIVFAQTILNTRIASSRMPLQTPTISLMRSFFFVSLLIEMSSEKAYSGHCSEETDIRIYFTRCSFSVLLHLQHIFAIIKLIILENIQ